LSLIAHYLNRGHSLEELLSLSPAEKLFFGIAWELEGERKAKAWEAVTSG